MATPDNNGISGGFFIKNNAGEINGESSSVILAIHPARSNASSIIDARSCNAGLTL